ncbi:hypothetical protein [Brevibacterium zhoupengii]|uniref:hypothetical protein n=1 Tax=Brevibacterium zhoupengii TaxID=2898795 RepID=UPI001E3AF090|nr:hypothetical protein [Brevibacterium zhoupengii]
MSTLLTPIRPPTFQRGPGRIVERTTTTTREIFLDDPIPTPPGPRTPSPHSPRTADDLLTHPSELQRSEMQLRGLNRVMVRLGVWLIAAGRRHALRPAARADEIARRLDDAKAHNMRHFSGLPY